ncbi:UDP-N-acetylglucosamine 2-epimerase (non-hydrolysing) [Salinimicrobium catena]|uniref:UDP-N-acetylglucosamine 2-epimerase (Non-hydrolysing) n=1 Tax=Salinimicrobium catena TaxID=390640 RepID=A0A1H5NAP2_9FLAO|nr:UDP-N-acetylglucosamine 2-epimerase (non-hydrolyzing) [Salinimicrobium catena]SDL41186.1 UDP-N-acetylglucosamine 2-epimerase (non-hydrolysing) [Salinimicrobium catena]SEE98584.1 UDP-N-acetylglucosamine 2-epimerase (non-hydrolysing) [Salinimicrobium catena]
MKIDLIAGARPNFVKIAALIHANLEMGEPVNFRLIHTGQHYDEGLSGSFFRQLEIPAPDINLHSGSGTQAEQTASLLISYEKVLLKEKPDLCLVVGDVTSSMACAITAKKMQIKVAHVEAGIRSYDWCMPEEVNRVLIDSIADYFFTTTLQASKQLLTTGKNETQIHFVGNTMIDTLLRFLPKFKKPTIWEELKLQKKNYLILTLHRPGNVDEKVRLKNALTQITGNSRGLPVIFPAHPRTALVLKKLNVSANNLHIIPPLSYLEFNYLVQQSKAVLTDSGGITEETTVMGIPCITLRENTERPETIELGTNELIGTNPAAIGPTLDRLFQKQWKKGRIPELWDGKASIRILEIISNLKNA